MSISSALASLNAGRFKNWSRDNGLRQAAGYMFDGDVYKHLEIDTLDAATLAEATRRLRILSGLYGLLRPTDEVNPYRLEMGRKIPGHPDGTLYRFWGSKISEALVEDAKSTSSRCVLNLASGEYAKAVDREALNGLDVIEPRFEEDRDGHRRVIGVTAKRARGAMARWVLENRITNPEDLTGFERGGFVYDQAVSTVHQPVFLKPSTVPA